MATDESRHGMWSSRLVFVLAAAGSAVLVGGSVDPGGPVGGSAGSGEELVAAQSSEADPVPVSILGRPPEGESCG